ncbi:MAG: hypothetical protein ACPGQL_10975 [Thermoplasmatota archaeon]
MHRTLPVLALLLLLTAATPGEARPLPVTVDHGTDCANCAGAWATIAVTPYGCADCTTSVGVSASAGPNGPEASASYCPAGRGQPCTTVGTR